MRIRITLNEEDFKHLVRGGVIEPEEGVQIALADIGFHTMLKRISDAMYGSDDENKPKDP